MADELADDRETGLLDVALNRRGDVPQESVRARLVDAHVQGLLGDLDQAGCLGRDVPHTDSDADVRPEPLEDQPEVQAHQVTAGDLAVAGDAVHRFVVDGDAYRARVAVVAQESGRRPALPDQAVGDAVEHDRLDPGLAGIAQRRQHRREQAARSGHQVDLVGGFEVDHAVFFPAPPAVPAPPALRATSPLRGEELAAPLTAASTWLLI